MRKNPLIRSRLCSLWLDWNFHSPKRHHPWNPCYKHFGKIISAIFLWPNKPCPLYSLNFYWLVFPSFLLSLQTISRLLTVTFGNIFVVIIAKIQLFDSQSGEFFLYAGLMALNVMLFIYLAMRYKYRAVIEDVENDEVTARNANVINMNSVPSLNDTFTVCPTTAAISAGTTPTNARSSLSNASLSNSEKLDSSPKCLKRNSCGKNGVDNYGYIDIWKRHLCTICIPFCAVKQHCADRLGDSQFCDIVISF